MGATHDWSLSVDAEHLRDIRSEPDVFAPGGVLHLVLEVLAYPVDEAEYAGGTTTAIDVALHEDGSISVQDNGRGTQTRVDADGTPTVKPVMATRDLRFFDHPEAQVLSDGHPRRGISVVAALSRWATHTNRRDGQRAWTQRYERGIPQGPLVDVADGGRSGTTIRFRPDPEVFGRERLTAAQVRASTTAYAGLVTVRADPAVPRQGTPGD